MISLWLNKIMAALLYFAGDTTEKVTAWDAQRTADRFGGWENIPEDYYDRLRWVDPLAWFYQILMRAYWFFAEKAV